MKWNWEQTDWPKFRFKPEAIALLESQFLSKSGELWGAFNTFSEADQDRLKIELISEEAEKNSKIEGEILDRDSVQSSIQKQFGLKSNSKSKKSLPAETGMAEMMVNLYRSFNDPLTHDQLFSWHEMILRGRGDISSIGNYRIHEEAMQVISGPSHKPKVHFEAPPSYQIKTEMDQFLKWFNESSPCGKTPISALIRAGIAHLYFVSIHPFEDGNGRLARVISEKSLAQNLSRPTLISLSTEIEKFRKTYYLELERSNKQNEITRWLNYFAQTVLDAQKITQIQIDFIVKKSKFYNKFRDQFNTRQEKIIARLFQEGVNGFKGGLSAENYISITKTSRTTATRDLNDFLDVGAFKKIGVLKHTRYYLVL